LKDAAIEAERKIVVDEVPRIPRRRWENADPGQSDGRGLMSRPASSPVEGKHFTTRQAGPARGTAFTARC